MAYRVTAPLVVAADQGGRNRHYYHGSVVHFLNDVQKTHFLRKGLVAEIVEADRPEEPVVESHSHPAKPAKTAPDKAWVDYGVTKGHRRDELESLTKPELHELLG